MAAPLGCAPTTVLSDAADRQVTRVSDAVFQLRLVAAPCQLSRLLKRRRRLRFILAIALAADALQVSAAAAAALSGGRHSGLIDAFMIGVQFSGACRGFVL